jgi:hypothetical protein
MKTSMTRFAFCRRLLCGSLLMLAAMIGTASAQDSWKIWTSAASTGTVDEEDLNKILFTDSLALFNPAAPAGVATIRYNVVAVDGLFASPTPTSWPALTIRYRDNGPNERVVVRLKEYILAGPGAGTTNTLITLDSDLYPQIAAMQSQSIGNCGVFDKFEFAGPGIIRIYFLEAEMTKGASGSPRLGGLAISRYGVCQGSFTQP